MGRILSGTVSQLGLAGQTLWVTAEGRSFQALATTNISSRNVAVLIDDNGRATVSDANAARPILTETRRFHQGKGKAVSERIPFGPGLYLLFDRSWWNTADKLNILIAQDLYTCPKKKIYYLSMADPRVLGEAGVNPTEQEAGKKGAKNAGSKFEEFATIEDLEGKRNSVIVFPALTAESRIKPSEATAFVDLIKSNKVIVQGDATDWDAFNIQTINLLGLTKYMEDGGDFFGDAKPIKKTATKKIIPLAAKSSGTLTYDGGRSFLATGEEPPKPIFPFVKQADNTVEESGMFWYSQVVNPLPPGLFIVFDVNWWTINSNLSNFAIDLAKDIYRNAEKKIYYLNDDRIYLLEGAATVFPNLQIVSATAAAQIDHSFIEVPTFQAVEEITDSTFIVPLFLAGTDITVQEANIIKNLAKNNRIFYQCEWNTWSSYNLRVLSKLGLSSYLTDLGNSSSSMSAILLDTPDVARIAPIATETGGSMFFNATRIFQTSNIDLVFPVIRPLEVSGDTTGMMFYVDPSVLIPDP